MLKNNNSIHINGKQYDATTGAEVGNKSVSRVIPVIHRPTRSEIERKPGLSANSHAPQTSQTLMRHAVKKPSIDHTSKIKAQGPAGVLSTLPHASIVIKSSVHRLDSKRMGHAKQVKKSQLVSRFSAAQLSATQTIHAPKTVKSIPVHPTPQIQKTSLTAKNRPKTTADLLEQALQHATAHDQTYTPQRRFGRTKRAAVLSAGSLAVIVFLGVAVSTSLPTIRVHLASSRAGFSASLPSYQPVGYRLGNLNYGPGSVSLNFTSNSDSRAFSIIEKTSRWDSSALHDIVVAPTPKQYQTIESAGRTIYLDNQHNATWVNSGVWYQVKTAGVLTDHQIVQIANSL